MKASRCRSLNARTSSREISPNSFNACAARPVAAASGRAKAAGSGGTLPLYRPPARSEAQAARSVARAGYPGTESGAGLTFFEPLSGLADQANARTGS